MDSGGGVFLKQLKMRIMRGLFTFYVKRIVDVRARMCNLKNRATKGENPEEDKEDGCSHDLGMKRMQGQVYKSYQMYKAILFPKVLILGVVDKATKTKDKINNKQVNLVFVKKLHKHFCIKI